MPYLYERANVFVLNGSLAIHLMKSTTIRAISHTLILQVAFATLIADGAIQWMVGKQKLHHAFSCLVCERAVCLDLHTRLYRPGARCNRLRCLDDLDQTHSAVPGNHEFLVVTVSGDRNARLLAGLDQCGAG